MWISCKITLIVEVAFRWSACFPSRYDNCSLASGSQEFNRRITDITHDIQALGFQDTHGDIEEEDYYLWWRDKDKVIASLYPDRPAIVPLSKTSLSTAHVLSITRKKTANINCKCLKSMQILLCVHTEQQVSVIKVNSYSVEEQSYFDQFNWLKMMAVSFSVYHTCTATIELWLNNAKYKCFHFNSNVATANVFSMYELSNEPEWKSFLVAIV